MDIKAKRERLLEGLIIVSNVASARTPKPVLQDVRIETKPEAVELSSTDLEIGVRFMVKDVEIREKGLATLPAARPALLLLLAPAIPAIPDHLMLPEPRLWIPTRLLLLPI